MSFSSKTLNADETVDIHSTGQLLSQTDSMRLSHRLLRDNTAQNRLCNETCFTSKNLYKSI